ncbi:MAG: cyclic-di-AMP receptor [Oscillospiraceae bacterium]|nr:cyclic-di-AMP receptor [Oscillospiraceae bacterium]
MKLVLSIISKTDAPVVVGALTKAGYPSTVTNSFGGFLNKENAILLSGVDDTKVSYVIGIIGENTSESVEQASRDTDGGYKLPQQIRVGGASVFVLDIEQFIHL